MNGNKDKNSFGKLEVTLPSGGEYGGGTVGVAELDKRREKLFEESKVLGTKRVVRPVYPANVGSFNVRKGATVVAPARGESGKMKALDEAKVKDDDGSGSDDTVEQDEDDEMAAQRRRVADLESRVRASKLAALLAQEEQLQRQLDGVRGGVQETAAVEDAALAALLNKQVADKQAFVPQSFDPVDLAKMEAVKKGLGSRSVLASFLANVRQRGVVESEMFGRLQRNKLSARSANEVILLARALDLIRGGSVAEGTELLARRMVGVFVADQQGRWEVLRALITEDDPGMVLAEDDMYAIDRDVARIRLRDGKAAKAGSGGRGAAEDGSQAKMKALQAQLLMQKKELAALHAKARRPKGKDALGGAQGKGQ